ncbi:MAG: 6-phosphogluconolactonase, partial [Acidobacteria bacterium]
MGDPAVVVDEVPALQQIFAAEFTSTAAAAVEARGKFVVAVPGGSVATTFFPVLAGLPVDWSRVDIFWVDERAVPPEHPDSNYGLASRLWLQPAGVP